MSHTPPVDSKGAAKYRKTRGVLLDLLTMLKDKPTNPDLWKLHIDLTCDKIERIWK